MLPDLLLSTALANPPSPAELSPGVMTYKPAELAYREDFSGGTFLYSEYWLPQKDAWGKYAYDHAIVQFRFDDGSEIMIEASPTISGFGPLKREGAQYVSISYGCPRETQECAEQYYVKMMSLEGAYFVTNSDEFKRNPQLAAERLVGLGRQLRRRITGDFYHHLVSHIAYANVLDDRIEAPLPLVLTEKDLRKVLREKKRLEKKLDRP